MNKFLRAKETRLLLSARLSHRNFVRPSVRSFVCLSHGWISQKQCKPESPSFTIGCLEDSSFLEAGPLNSTELS